MAALAHTRDARSQWATEALSDWMEDEVRQLTTLLEKLADGLDGAGRCGTARAPAVAG